MLFYYLDRGLFPKIVSALSPGGLFVCKMAVRWDLETALPKSDFSPLDRDELLLLVPGLQEHIRVHRQIYRRHQVGICAKELMRYDADNGERNVVEENGLA